MDKEEGSRPWDIARYKREAAECEATWNKITLERIREAKENGRYISGADLKKSKAARLKRGSGYAGLPSQLDPQGDRLEELLELEAAARRALK